MRKLYSLGNLKFSFKLYLVVHNAYKEGRDPLNWCDKNQRCDGEVMLVGCFVACK